MANFLSHAAAQARCSLGQSKIDVKHSWLLEIFAACLGYETLAALTSEQTDESLQYHVGDAEILVLNHPWLFPAPLSCALNLTRSYPSASKRLSSA